MIVDIKITEPNDVFCVKTTYNDKVKWCELRMPCDPDTHKCWMLANLRFIYDLMPIAKINVNTNKGVLEKYSTVLDTVLGLFEYTNSFIAEHAEEKGKAASFTNILFVNVSEDMRYRSFYGVLKAREPNTLYLNINIGFDRKTRKWTKKKNTPIPLGEFLKYLFDNEIGTIVTVNHYFIDSYMVPTGINLIPVLKHIGCRLVTIDNDPPDLRPHGYLNKTSNNEPSWTRFSNLYCLSNYWDRKLDNTNVYPCAIPQDYSGNVKPLSDDYKIVMLSNSRWESVLPLQNHIDAVLSLIEKPYADLVTWYMALRRMILRADLTEYERYLQNSQLHQFFFMAAQCLKFRAIKGLKVDREIEVYGDVGWENVCPEYYKGSLENDQIEELFKRDDVVMLLANCSYTYLDASGPVYDMVRRGVHWVNIPPVAKSNTLAGLHNIEYTTDEELGTLLSDIKPAFSRANICLMRYRNILQSSVLDILHGIKTNEQNNSVFYGHLTEHEYLVNKRLDEYQNQNEELLRSSLGMFK